MPLAATALALSAILLWSFLAYLGARLTHVPPFLLVGIALAISGLLGLPLVRTWRVSIRAYLVGIGGLFGYHFLYFSAFRHAPAIEGSLINYLWPLLIVVLSPLLLPGTRLHLHHLVGAAVGFLGAGLIVTGGRVSLDLAHLRGYLYMAGAALTWSCYSLLSKRLPRFSTGAVGGFCLASGALSLGVYALSSAGASDLARLTTGDWLGLVALGLGPMGAAFYAWDAALKRGDPRVIGSLAYLTPMSSTLVLVVLGGKSLSWTTALAMTLIVSGAAIGSLDLLKAHRERSSPA